jgi:2-polyprenyl-3-methyl-5-hydroxy-6-metoxy-1,4-benzoquinol methylase
MNETDSAQRHWDRVYREREGTQVSWYQAEPHLSLRLLASADLAPGAAVLDIGAGTSSLPEHLLAAGYHVGVLDLSNVALARQRERLANRAEEVEWFHADVRDFASPREWDAWHDRAVFNFLLTAAERRAYRDTLMRSLRPNGIVILATFGPQGPERCSGLPTNRYAPDELARELGTSFQLVHREAESHRTPQGKAQEFTYCLFRRTG